MGTPRPLDQLLVEVAARIERLGTPLFPAAPIVGESTPVATWPGDLDGFLDLVGNVAPPLVYEAAERVTQGDIEALVMAADERQAALDEDEQDTGEFGSHGEEEFEFDSLTDEYLDRASARAQVEKWRVAAANAAVQVGVVGRLDVTFMAGGVLHEWVSATDWFDEFETARMEAAATARRRTVSSSAFRARMTERREKEQEAQRCRVDLDPTVNAWVESLLKSPKFVGGVSRETRFAIAGNLIPELETWRSKSVDLWTDAPGWARWRAARDAAFEAEEQLQSVKDERVAALRAREREFATALMSESEFRALRTKAEQKRYVHDRVEAELWFRSASATDRILAVARDLMSAASDRGNSEDG